MRGGRHAGHAPALVKFAPALELLLNSLVSDIQIAFLASLKSTNRLGVWNYFLISLEN